MIGVTACGGNQYEDYSKKCINEKNADACEWVELEERQWEIDEIWQDFIEEMNELSVEDKQIEDDQKILEDRIDNPEQVIEETSCDSTEFDCPPQEGGDE